MFPSYITSTVFLTSTSPINSSTSIPSTTLVPSTTLLPSSNPTPDPGPNAHVVDLTAADTYWPSESHSISYNVSSVYFQSNDGPFNISISWDGCDPPTCWVLNRNFYNRVTPGSYKGANDFKLDVSSIGWYFDPILWNVTLDVAKGSTAGYECDAEEADSGKTLTCTLEGKGLDEGLNREWAKWYYQDAVIPSPLC
ncbi:unnamed protein product [Zymoseptoria tritici ST99CH_1A5]|uniref:Uncharacterized protein n=3 Tax=Zymoseptoria tritici TaxID=1047171 RepID=A0A1X7RP44_ZYMT9|nr:unnamed protein product [Zymoseptoria tritici ST99CH_3D7]SMR49004.1 unnamed protein product [Zymoseptoria tritici ST99CH_1E4]SMR50181.1 unnamed protein product [Zymoseptoria tritici ST99CH_3D1]SMY22882.1 unnamed protein product [Zymoseptoria tritici ST99CH_1A5]